ncbi:hypothetical protein S40288_11335 [Stachybotrys chartarum IBT 40288]|nr:hypothetical protein S40288_11335 [Stachybotrys chartarum IBT 40288]
MGKTVLTAARICGVYMIDEAEEDHFQAALASFSVGDSRLHLWHERFAHLGERNIKKLIKMSTGIRPNEPPSDPCEASTEQHQQNGLAEVLNRILLEKLTPTLLNSELHLKWWPYLLKAVNYIRNLCPTASMTITPYQA